MVAEPSESLYVKRSPSALFPVFISSFLSGPVVPTPTLPFPLILICSWMAPPPVLVQKVKADASEPFVALVRRLEILPANSSSSFASSRCQSMVAPIPLAPAALWTLRESLSISTSVSVELGLIRNSPAMAFCRASTRREVELPPLTSKA